MSHILFAIVGLFAGCAGGAFGLYLAMFGSPSRANQTLARFFRSLGTRRLGVLLEIKQPDGSARRVSAYKGLRVVAVRPPQLLPSLVTSCEPWDESEPGGLSYD